MIHEAQGEKSIIFFLSFSVALLLQGCLSITLPLSLSLLLILLFSTPYPQDITNVLFFSLFFPFSFSFSQTSWLSLYSLMSCVCLRRSFLHSIAYSLFFPPCQTWWKRVAMGIFCLVTWNMHKSAASFQMQILPVVSLFAAGLQEILSIWTVWNGWLQHVIFPPWLCQEERCPSVLWGIAWMDLTYANTCVFPRGCTQQLVSVWSEVVLLVTATQQGFKSTKTAEVF